MSNTISLAQPFTAVNWLDQHVARESVDGDWDAGIDLYDLIPDPVERTIVHVQASGWHLFGQIGAIADPLRAGSIVDVQCGPTWCALAAEGAAVDISAALLELGIVHTHAVIGQEGFWSIVFAPLGVL